MEKRLRLIRRKQLWDKYSDGTFVKCFYCRKEIYLAETTIEHLTPQCLDGSNELINLRLTCKMCNNEMGHLVAKHILRYRYIIQALRR